MSGTTSDARSRQLGQPAADWLDHHPQGVRLMQTAHELLAIEAALRRQLPGALAQRTCVASRDGTTLTLIVPGPAHAARLRQLTGRAAQALQAAGWPVEQIVVRIDARRDPADARRSQREIEPLGPGALAAFRELEADVAPGPLAEAIRRLLRHHGA